MSKILSKAGKITLSKSVLSSIPNFFMQLERLPSKMHKELDMLVHNYVWGVFGQQMKIHLLNWNTLCKPKKIGGGGGRVEQSKPDKQGIVSKADLEGVDEGWGYLV